MFPLVDHGHICPHAWPRINVRSGKIPRQLGKLDALQSLDLSFNALEGDGVRKIRRWRGFPAVRREPFFLFR